MRPLNRIIIITIITIIIIIIIIITSLQVVAKFKELVKLHREAEDKLKAVDDVVCDV